MDIPHAAVIAPCPAVDSIAAIPTNAEVAAVLARAPDFDMLPRRSSLRTLWISGPRDAEVRIVGSMQNLETLIVWDARIANLEALAGLTGLTTLRIAASPKLKSLAGLERLTNLSELLLYDCCNYGTLAEVVSLSHLETLCVEGGFSKSVRVPTLAPLANLAQLRRLRLANIRVEDGSLRALHGLQALRDVFVAKQFSDHELGLAARALPLARGAHLDSFRASG